MVIERTSFSLQLEVETPSNVTGLRELETGYLKLPTPAPSLKVGSPSLTSEPTIAAFSTEPESPSLALSQWWLMPHHCAFTAIIPIYLSSFLLFLTPTKGKVLLHNLSGFTLPIPLFYAWL